MTTKMLINASRAQQLRVAIVDGTILQEYQVEIAEKGLCRGNIYRGVVANLQPSLNAAFIDIGEERHGFLPVADVLSSAYHKTPPKDAKRPRIDQVLEKGKPILVQVTKDGVGQKGAALSTNLALAGRYLVFTPFDGVRGISRKAADDEARKTIRKRLQKLELPEGNGVIVRTNGLDQNQATLNRDLNALLRLWRKIKAEGGRGRGAKLIYSDQDLVVQSLRDYLDPDIGEVIVDSDPVFEKAQSFMKAFMPRSKTELTRYDDRLPLFSRYRLETQIDQIYQRAASLPSGGYLVIDQTEALTAIDVNSGRATRTSNHDESILNVNIEAAKEVARQLRLRDIGGLIVVDFIDMRLRKHQNKLERVMRDSMKPDKARWSVGRISSNGLLEINRQRIKQALRLRSHHQCPTCEGTGTIPTPEFAAMRLLSKIEARASTQNMASVTVGLHPAMADELQNHYRRDLADLERLFDIEIEIIAAPNLKRSEERIEWVQREGGSAPEAPVRRRSAAVSAMDLTSTKRGRGRGRRRADDDEPPAKEARSGSRDGKRDDSSREDSNRDDEQAKSSKSRRRRRRRKKSSSSDDKGPETSRQVAVQGGGDEPTRDAGADATESESGGRSKTTRTRRRRRRRRGTGSDDAETQAQSSREETTDDKVATEPEQAAKNASDAEESKPTRKVRRRRSRRRRSSDDSVETAADDAASPDEDESTEAVEEVQADSADAGDDTTSDDAPRRKSRRRRRRRSSDRDETPEETTHEAVDLQEPADATEATEAAEADDATEAEAKDARDTDDESDQPKKVTRRRRSSRARRPRRASEDEADAQADADDDETAADDADTEGSIEERAAASRERRRRRRTRSRSASTADEAQAVVEAADDSPGGDSPGDEVGGNGHRQALATDDLASLDPVEPEPSEGDSAGDAASEASPAFHPEIAHGDSQRVDTETVDGQTVDGETPAVDDDASELTADAADGDQVEPPPAEGLRWQWWGTPIDPAPEPQVEGTGADDSTD